MKIQNLKIIIISVIVLIIAFFIIFFVVKGNNNQNNMQDKLKNIRQAVLFGQFYPARKKELSAMIDDYLEQATTSNPSTSSGQAPRILIVPHAGYVYSGRVATFGFKTLRGSNFERVIIIGRSHQQYFDGVAADDSDAWETPLGSLAVDKDFIIQLKKLDNDVKINNQPHQTEHSLEVEIPFLQRVLGNGVKIVPLLFGDDNKNTVLNLAGALKQLTDEKTLLVISSDLSHYPAYESAKKLDQKTIEAILGLDVGKFNIWINQAETGQIPEADTLACGAPAIELAILMAKHLGLKPQLLKYANSGDYFAETKDRVVGYAAIAFYNPLGVVKSETDDGLNKEEQKIALQVARKILEVAFDEKTYQLPVALPEIFQEKRGVFVTLKKQGELRGCIGNFTPDVGLAENIQEMAKKAAFNDPRFAPLEKTELKDVEIEISVLSSMQKITDPNLIEVGKHGVYVKKGSRGGVYLPQVATELGWNKEQFLNSLCAEKAGLNKDCWKDDTTDLYIFTAQVFSE